MRKNGLKMFVVVVVGQEDEGDDGFTHFLPIVLTASGKAYIIYKQTYRQWLIEARGKVPMTHKAFVSSLIKSVLGNFCSRKIIGRPFATLPLKRKLSKDHQCISLVKHKMVPAGRCKNCSKASRRKESSFGCNVCHVRFCHEICFEEYHANLLPTDGNDTE